MPGAVAEFRSKRCKVPAALNEDPLCLLPTLPTALRTESGLQTELQVFSADAAAARSSQKSEGKSCCSVRSVSSGHSSSASKGSAAA
jgi:hypothetical protein